jgi:hypothetical protein
MTPAKSPWRVNWIALVAAAISGIVGSFLALNQSRYAAEVLAGP